MPPVLPSQSQPVYEFSQLCPPPFTNQLQGGGDCSPPQFASPQQCQIFFCGCAGGGQKGGLILKPDPLLWGGVPHLISASPPAPFVSLSPSVRRTCSNELIIK